mmetsp:Transcript_9826/g.16154  ORF Transcript_9826/g.16154 Transcript_9826/m.16154 type:complete len:231 (-) Transcript_9826:53-745(-)
MYQNLVCLASKGADCAQRRDEQVPEKDFRSLNHASFTYTKLRFISMMTRFFRHFNFEDEKELPDVMILSVGIWDVMKTKNESHYAKRVQQLRQAVDEFDAKLSSLKKRPLVIWQTIVYLHESVYQNMRDAWRRGDRRRAYRATQMAKLMKESGIAGSEQGGPFVPLDMYKVTSQEEDFARYVRFPLPEGTHKKDLDTVHTKDFVYVWGLQMIANALQIYQIPSLDVAANS